MTPRERIRRGVRTFLLLMLILVLYFVIGAATPFVYLRPTGTGSGDLARYYGDGEGAERAVVIDDNGEALLWRLRLIAEAKEEIILATYQFKTGKSSDALGAALMDAADRGVSVKILVDGFSGVCNMEGKTFFEALSAYPGIEIRIYNRFEVLRPWSCSGRLHDKYFVVDDLAYIAGGRNTHDGFLGDTDSADRNYDREVLVWNTAAGTESGADASVFSIYAYFDEVWNGEHTTGFRGGDADPNSRKMQAEYARLRVVGAKNPSFDEPFADYCRSVTLPTDRVSVIRGETGIYGKNPLVWSEIKQLMLSAEERVVVQSPYVMCGKFMYQDLREIASATPAFSIITNSVANTDNRFAPADYLYHQDEILDTGVQIYEFDGSYSSHTKSILIDNHLTLIGSFNFDLRSTYIATEMMIVIEGEAFNAEISQSFEEVLTSCQLITEENTVDIRVKEVPLIKQIWWRIFGILLYPFRFEL